MSSNVYGFSLDKPYYLRSALCELGLSAVSAASAAVMPMPLYIPLATATFAGFMGVRHALYYMHSRKGITSLNDGNFFTLSPDAMREKRIEAAEDAGLDDNYYLGRGFTWTPRYMSLYETIKNDPQFASLSDHTNKAGGKPFIHNIGKAEEADRVANLKEHTLIAGESGSGKTVLLNLLVAQFIQDGEAVCIIDPKGDKDLLNSVYALCQTYGREEDFLFFSLTHPGKSITFDPMANALKSNDAANRITSIMDLTGGGKTFQDYCWSVLNLIAESMINGNHKLNICNLLRFTSINGMKELHALNNEVLFSITNENQRLALTKSQALLDHRSNHPSEHFAKMTVSLEPLLLSLGTGEVGHLLSPEKADTSWKDIIKNRRVVYFNLSSMVDSYTSSSVCKLLVQDLISYIGQMYAYEKKPSRIKLICDEFYSIVYKGFGDALNKSRQAGMHAILGLQTESDIAAQTDKNMVDVMLGNLPNKISLRISEEHLADKIAKKFEEAEHTTIMKQRSTSAAPTDSALLFKSSTSERTQTRTQTIVTKEMIMGLPQGQAFVYNKGMMPLKIAIPMLELEAGVRFFEDILNREFRLAPEDFFAPIDKLIGHSGGAA